MGKQTSETYVLMNQLILDALGCSERQALAEFFVNETKRVVPYTKATLWDIELYNPRLLGVSGEEGNFENLEIPQESLKLIHKIDDKENMQLVPNEDKKSFLWVPISINYRTTLGLLLERSKGSIWEDEEKKTLEIIAQGYGHAWKGSFPEWTISVLQKIRWIVTALVCLILLSIIPVPSRVDAPCEVIAEEQVAVKAPHDGMIEKILVDSGDEVTAGQPLFSYNKDALMKELKVAREKLEAASTEPVREREKLHLQLLQERLGELSVKSSVDGFVDLHDLQQWKGRKVLAGEQVLSISDPRETKLRIAFPDDKEIVVNPERPIQVRFNGDNSRSYEARILSIHATTLNIDEETITFIADAMWKKQPEDLDVGEKGVAVLYGQNVPLIYWLMHMPFSLLF